MERLDDLMMFSELSTTAEVGIFRKELVGFTIISVDEGFRLTSIEEISGLVFIFVERSVTFLELLSIAELGKTSNRDVDCSVIFKDVDNKSEEEEIVTVYDC